MMRIGCVRLKYKTSQWSISYRHSLYHVMKDKIAEVKAKFWIYCTIFVVNTTKNCLLRNAMVFYFVILKECIYLHDAFAFAKSERDVGGSHKVRPCGVWQLYASRQFSFRHLTKSCTPPLYRKWPDTPSHIKVITIYAFREFKIVITQPFLNNFKWN